MKKIAAAFLALAIFLGIAQCVDLGIGLGRDALYLPDSGLGISDSTNTPIPASALLSVDFGVGHWLTLGVKTGYSWYRSASDIFGGSSDERWRIDAARIELIPTAQSPLFFDWLTLRAGIGVSGMFSYTDHYKMLFDTFYFWEDDWNRYVGAITQSFVAGVQFRVSPRVNLSLDAEWPGFAVAYVYRYGYIRQEWDDHWQEFLEDKSLKSGWTSRPVAGFGASLHFKL